MTVGTAAFWIEITAIVLYIVLGVVLAVKSWLIRAGLAMAAISLLPLYWQANFTDSEALGNGLLLGVMLLPALGVIAAGLVRWTHRYNGRCLEDAGS